MECADESTELWRHPSYLDLNFTISLVGKSPILGDTKQKFKSSFDF